MKPILLSLLPVAIYFSSVELSATIQKPDSNFCLEVVGKINDADGKASKYKVELFAHNTLIDSDEKNARKKFHLFLEANQYYTLRISMPGYHARLVCIDTKNLIQLEEDELYLFSFETELMPEYSAQLINKDLVDYPIAIIYFDEKTKRFAYNKEYTTSLKHDLYHSAEK